MTDEMVKIDDLMVRSGVRFGTSGARGLASDMTDEVAYLYTAAFLQHLETTAEMDGQDFVAIGGDLRPSTDRIMKAVSKAVHDKGHAVENCGNIPSPALAHYGLGKGIPTIMVTGSHIPKDRNGIKYTKKEGEILKHDEAGIRSQVVRRPPSMFDGLGMFKDEVRIPPPSDAAVELYEKRYVDFFSGDCLKGKNIGLYQHSAVGRDLTLKILLELGAKVTPLGFSEEFIPVDTEAIRSEDIELAKQWAQRYRFDSVVATDGDGDRPLVSDENGNWLRGDIAGILCARYFEAETVVTPVSSNSSVESCGWFRKTVRTKIGSPYVIEAMQTAWKRGFKSIVGYEANGGFLLGSDFHKDGKTLTALPTRDALIVLISVLALSAEQDKKISELLQELPQRFTYSDRLKAFPTERSRAIISQFHSDDELRDKEALEEAFFEYFGGVSSTNMTDGLRITFGSGEIIHFRPSGNAPEFRCYSEADSKNRAKEIIKICLSIMNSWR
jgi:phosphomannomutase